MKIVCADSMEDAVEKTKGAEAPSTGNAFLTEEQAEAIENATDAIADLVNVSNIHPCYVVGFLEMTKHTPIDDSMSYYAKAFGIDGIYEKR